VEAVVKVEEAAEVVEAWGTAGVVAGGRGEGAAVKT